MEVPIWVATILVGAVLSMLTYLVKLIFDIDKRVTRLEERIKRNGGNL